MRYVGQIGDRFTSQLITKDKNIEYEYSILAGKLRRFHGKRLHWYIKHFDLIIKNIRDFIFFIIGFFQSLIIMIFWRPNIIFVKGGYVGLPVGLAGAFLRISIITHDSDAVPGLTNRLLSRFVDIQAVALKKDYYLKYYNSRKIVATGVPIDSKFKPVSNEQKKDIKKELGISTNNQLLTIVGGSLGAEKLNSSIIEILKNLDQYKSNLSIIWSTGKNNYHGIENILNKKNIGIKIYLKPFINNLDQVFQVSDLVISRAGATTIAELAAVGTPTILIPNPILTGGHQIINAQAMESQGACVHLEEKSIDKDPNILFNEVIRVLGSKDFQQHLSSNIKKIAVKSSASKIAELLIRNAK